MKLILNTVHLSIDEIRVVERFELWVVFKFLLQEDAVKQTADLNLNANGAEESPSNNTWTLDPSSETSDPFW